MPTVLRDHGFRYFFFSKENNEPPHIHVSKGDGYAKYWLEPVYLANSVGFKANELGKIKKVVELNKNYFIDKWNEYFSE